MYINWSGNSGIAEIMEIWNFRNHKHFIFGNNTCSVTLIMKVFLVSQSYCFFFFCKNHIGFKWHSKIVTFDSHISFFHIYDHLFSSYTCFHKCLWSVKWQSQIFYIWKSYLFFHIYCHLSIPCLVVFFFSFMQITSNFFTCVSIHNTNAYVKWQSQIFCISQAYVFFNMWPLMYSLSGRQICYANHF